MSDPIDIILNFIDNTVADIERVRIETHKELVASVIGDTPVDSGMARRNWIAGRDAIPTNIIPYAGGDGSESIGEGQATAFGEDGTFYLVNNVHYVPYLELGTSRMSAIGMARKNSQRIINNLRAQYG